MKKMLLVLLLLSATINSANDTLLLRPQGGGDYTTLSAAVQTGVVGLSPVIAGDTVVIVCDTAVTGEDASGHYDWDGWTAGGVVKVVGLRGGRHNGTRCDTCYTSGTDNATMDLERGTTIFEGIQFNFESTNEFIFSSLNTYWGDTSTSLIFDQCIINNDGKFNFGAGSNGLVFTLLLRNCIIYDTISAAGGSFIDHSLGASDSIYTYLYNCTFDGQELILDNSGTGNNLWVTNCIFTDIGDYASDGAGWGIAEYNTVSYCVTDSAAATSDASSNSRFSQTVSYVDPSAGVRDYHLESDDESSIDFGTDLSSAHRPFTIDIDYETRTGTWDVGADQQTVVGGDVFLFRRRRLGSIEQQMKILVQNMKNCIMADIANYNEKGNL